MDGACIFKSFTEQGCLISALGEGDTDSPWEWGLGRLAMERGKGSPVGPPRGPQNGAWCPGQCSAKGSAWKGLSSSMKVTFAGDNHCLLWDVGRLWSRVSWAAESCRMCSWGRLVSRQRRAKETAGLGQNHFGSAGHGQGCRSADIYLLKPQRVGRAGTSCPGA